MDGLAAVGEIDLALSDCFGQLGTFAGNGFFQQIADAFFENFFAFEFNVANVRHHRTHFGPDFTIEVDLQHARVFQFECTLAKILFGGLF